MLYTHFLYVYLKYVTRSTAGIAVRQNKVHTVSETDRWVFDQFIPKSNYYIIFNFTIVILKKKRIPWFRCLLGTFIDQIIHNYLD